jgi:hypothetical protein
VREEEMPVTLLLEIRLYREQLETQLGVPVTAHEALRTLLKRSLKEIRRDRRGPKKGDKK